MTDLVERLRDTDCDHQCGNCDKELKSYAADEIERLREDLNEYKLKLRFAYEREAGWIENISNCKTENERLKKALWEIHGLGDTPDDAWKAYQICCKALGEEE